MDKSSPQRQYRCLSPIAGTQFGEDAADMHFDGAQTHKELPGNFVIDVSLNQQFQHLQLFFS